MTTVLKTSDVGMVFRMVHNRADSLKSKTIGLFNPRYREKVESFRALDGVSIELRRGESVALLGKNGSGKSTLLKVAAGILAPTKGQVCHSGAAIGTIIELGVGFNLELTGRENVFLNAALHGASDEKTESIYQEIVEFSGLGHFMDIPIKNYSSGMQMRLGFALESALWPDILLIDEVLAVGDSDFQAKCRARLADYKARGGSILLVTHNMNDALEICDRGYLLENGKVSAQGPIKEVVAAYTGSTHPAEPPPTTLPCGMETRLGEPLSSALEAMQEGIAEKTSYFGIKTMKNPLDFWAYQEIISARKPDVIIEIGNFRGGSTLALAHLCDLAGHGRVIALDLSHAEIEPKAKNHPRITWLEGDGFTNAQKVKELIMPGERTMVIEDSSHTMENTFNLLQAYAPFIAPGDYFVVEDGICHHGLDVGPNPGPYEAVEKFLSLHPEFEADRARESFMITWNPKGYLRRKE